MDLLSSMQVVNCEVEHLFSKFESWFQIRQICLMGSRSERDFQDLETEKRKADRNRRGRKRRRKRRRINEGVRRR